MTQFLHSPEDIKALLTLLILVGAIYGFVSEKVSPDVTALLALLALLITGILTPSEAFAGFSHPATVSVAAILVLSAAIEHTGAPAFVARRVLAPFVKSEVVFTGILMLAVGLISAFINNTAAVAVFIPIVLDACRRHHLSPGRVLMPMSHAATFGGMCTLIGTSTNLVSHEFALKQGLRGFGMFELGKVGLPMMLVGGLYALFVGRRFLPGRKDAQPEKDQANYVAELIAKSDSGYLKKPVAVAEIKRDYDLDVIALVRDEQVKSLEDVPLPVLKLGDALLVRGPLPELLKLAKRHKLEIRTPKKFGKEPLAEADDESAAGEASNKAGYKHNQPGEAPDETAPELAEVVVLTPSGLVGSTLRSARFAERYDAAVLALRRRGRMNERPSRVRLHAGDMLVVQASRRALTALDDSPGFLVVGTVSVPEERPRRLLITLATLAGVIGVVSFGLLPIVTAATAGCVVLMLTGHLKPREAYRAIDLSLVFLLAGSLALGAALEKTGLTEKLAFGLAGLTGVTGPFVVMAAFFLVAVILSELMSNSGTVALLGPVAISSATQMGINPMALLAAVTFGSSAAFAMPIGYQTSLMIYGPGGYSFRDFVRMGIPLDLILAALALLLIPYYWPLR
jgi:di/tricarboxylate transporter